MKADSGKTQSSTKIGTETDFRIWLYYHELCEQHIAINRRILIRGLNHIVLLKFISRSVCLHALKSRLYDHINLYETNSIRDKQGTLFLIKLFFYNQARKNY